MLDEFLFWGNENTYAETPTFSKTAAVATIDFASVKPNLYVQGATGLVPAPAMALVRVVTCVASVPPIDFKLAISIGARPRAAKSESGNLAKPCW